MCGLCKQAYAMGSPLKGAGRSISRSQRPDPDSPMKWSQMLCCCPGADLKSNRIYPDENRVLEGIRTPTGKLRIGPRAQALTPLQEQPSNQTVGDGASTPRQLYEREVFATATLFAANEGTEHSQAYQLRSSRAATGLPVLQSLQATRVFSLESFPDA